MCNVEAVLLEKMDLLNICLCHLCGRARVTIQDKPTKLNKGDHPYYRTSTIIYNEAFSPAAHFRQTQPNACHKSKIECQDTLASRTKHVGIDPTNVVERNKG